MFVLIQISQKKKMYRSFLTQEGIIEVFINIHYIPSLSLTLCLCVFVSSFKGCGVITQLSSFAVKVIVETLDQKFQDGKRLCFPHSE